MRVSGVFFVIFAMALAGVATDGAWAVGFIGDYRKEQETQTSQKADNGEASAAAQKAVDKAKGVT